jgi:FlgD Ig-like domain/Concanavalin A-like lectin/glucanases superfamily/Domain of unknown function (DUF2341)
MLRFHRLLLPTLFCLTVLAPMLPAVAADAAGAAAWVDPGWAHRVRLTAKPALLPPSGALTDFSVLVTLDSDSLSALFPLAKSDGSDLLVTADDGLTVLEHEIVSYDSSAQRAELWFKAPQLSATQNEFYLYYGNADTTISSLPGGAWGPEHLAVYHFQDDPGLGILSDSGPGGNFGESEAGSGWTSSNRQAGQIGSGWNFDGISNWVYSDLVSSADSTYTISAWASRPNGPLSGRLAFQSLDGFWNLSFQRSGSDLHQDLETANGFITWEPVVVDSTMHHFVWTLDAAADTAFFYLDGVELNVEINWAPAAPYHAYIGENIGGRVGIAGPANFNSLDLMEGTVDEYRIVEGARSSDWIATEYDNQSQGPAFFGYVFENRPVVTGIDPVLPRSMGKISVWPNPFSFAAQIDVQSASDDLAVEVYDLAGRRVRVLRPRSTNPGTLQLSWDGRDQAGIDVSSGVYYVRALGRKVTLSAKVLLVR